jgi:hypothetical protein
MTVTATAPAPLHTGRGVVEGGGTSVLPFRPVSDTSALYLERAAASLSDAITSTDPGLRYAHAHVAALRATTALLAARATPAPVRRGRAVQRNAWVLLARVAPEFAEWATFFSAGAAKRAAAEAGSVRAVTEREADDLVRDADRYLGLVEESLGMTRHLPLPTVLPALLPGPSRAERSGGDRSAAERRR